ALLGLLGALMGDDGAQVPGQGYGSAPAHTPVRPWVDPDRRISSWREPPGASAALPPNAYGRTVSCSSYGATLRSCPLPAEGRAVRLVQEFEAGRCRLGTSWRYDFAWVHVRDGCRGLFEVVP
ncbi:MAG: DUF3011 domain-containing protein, partial [Aquabacterium sp.]